MMFSFIDGYPKKKDTNTPIMAEEEEECIHVLQPALQYAFGQTSHLKRRRQQESIAACQPWLMRSRSKTREIHQRNFGEKG